MSMEDLRYLASEQYGLITTAQAEGVGVSRVAVHRMVGQGELRSIRRGVFSFESAPVASHEEVRAAWLALDPGRTVAERLQDEKSAVICTTSAAAVLGIGDFETEQHEFYVYARKQSRASDIHIRVRSVEIHDIQVVEGLKVTSPTRIVTDLLAEIREIEHIGTLLVDAVQRGYTIDWQRVRRAVEQCAKLYGMPGDRLFAGIADAAKDLEARSVIAQNLAFLLSPGLREQLTKNLEGVLKPFAEVDWGLSQSLQHVAQSALAPVTSQLSSLPKETLLKSAEIFRSRLELLQSSTPDEPGTVVGKEKE